MDYTYQGEIVRFVDGDTVDMSVTKVTDFGFGLTLNGTYKGRFRLTIVDTPERGEPGWAEATAFCRKYLPIGTKTRVETYKSPDSFGRYLADIYVPLMGNTTISSLLLEAGLAEVWK